MFKQNNTYSYRNLINLIFTKLIHTAFVFLLLIIFLPEKSFSQPLAHNKTKFVGNIIGNGNSIHSNFDDYWNQVTAENAGKWSSVEPVQDSYNWTQLDNIYNYALNNNFPYKHHTLVWGSQEPGWVSSLDSATQYDEVVEWISLVGQRYPDADFCDVVNEPLHAPPSYKNALGGDGETGWDWVIKSFELARQYLSPDTKLHLNEYSVINDNNANADFIEIINLLKDRGLIDGIGVQGHNFEVNGGASVTSMTNNLTNLAGTGLPVFITEFDINESNDNTQLIRYQTIFPPIYEHPGVTGITLWGYIQYEIWQANAYLLTDRFAERPAMQWLRSYLRAPFRPVLISPKGTTNELRNPLLVWHPSPDSVTAYHLQVATNSSFANIVVDLMVTDTLAQLDTLSANTRYYWRVSSVHNDNGESPFSPSTFFTTGDQILDVDEHGDSPDEFVLYQNYPNPFNPVTTISFNLPERKEVKMVLLNILGQVIKEIASGEYDVGNHNLKLDASNLASGIYLYRIEAGEFVNTKKLILMK